MRSTFILTSHLRHSSKSKEVEPKWSLLDRGNENRSRLLSLLEHAGLGTRKEAAEEK